MHYTVHGASTLLYTKEKKLPGDLSDVAFAQYKIYDACTACKVVEYRTGALLVACPLYRSHAHMCQLVEYRTSWLFEEKGWDTWSLVCAVALPNTRFRQLKGGLRGRFTKVRSE